LRARRVVPRRNSSTLANGLGSSAGAAFSSATVSKRGGGGGVEEARGILVYGLKFTVCGWGRSFKRILVGCALVAQRLFRVYCVNISLPFSSSVSSVVI